MMFKVSTIYIIEVEDLQNQQVLSVMLNIVFILYSGLSVKCHLEFTKVIGISYNHIY